MSRTRPLLEPRTTARTLGVAKLLLAVMVTAGCAAPAAQESQAPSVTATPPVRPSASGTPPSVAPTPTATTEPTGGASGAALVVPSFVSVTADRLLIRKEPGLTGEPLMSGDGCIDNPVPNCARPILIGTETGYVDLYVVDGPTAVDGYDWYLVATDPLAVVGWVAAGDAADAWLASAPRSCPSQPVELADVSFQSMTRLEVLHCFGGQELTVRSWYPELPPGEQETNVGLEDCRVEHGWLSCHSVFDMLRPEPGPWAGSADYLAFTVDPDAGVSLPARSQWVEVTGSFDHSAAATCGELWALLNCRTMFVINSAVVPQEP